ncbi:MAG: magnesium transporter [Bacillota bacterium]|nr:MAG: magnesium transporter [Bacillota bacterium]
MLKELLEKGTKKQIISYLIDAHPHDLSEVFFELNDVEKERFYQIISDEKFAEIVSYMDERQAADLLAEFDVEKQKRIVEMMEPDDAADIILELDEDEQEELVELLGESSDVVKLMSYDEDETGSAMTSLILTTTPDVDIKVATKKVIKEAADVESINTIFVVDENNHYIGVVPLKKLLKAQAPLNIKDLVEEREYAFDHDLLTETLDKISNYDIYEMPVVNEKKQLLGMITFDDAIDLYQEEAQEDFERLAALPETLDTHVFKTALHRLPWLITLLIISVPIAIVTSLFEETLALVAILIVFQPLILGSAGNVATQTLAVTLKMFSTNEKGFSRNAIKEVLTGIMNGLVIGLIAFLVTLIFAYINTSLTQNPFLVAFVVGLSLWLTVIIAPIVAIVIPLTLKSLKIDPAVASGPFITTVIDVGALFIYFGLATLFLGGL